MIVRDSVVSDENIFENDSPSCVNDENPSHATTTEFPGSPTITTFEPTVSTSSDATTTMEPPSLSQFTPFPTSPTTPTIASNSGNIDTFFIDSISCNHGSFDIMYKYNGSIFCP